MAWSWVGLGDAVASYSCELAGFDRVPNPPFNYPLAATENDNVGAGTSIARSPTAPSVQRSDQSDPATNPASKTSSSPVIGNRGRCL